MRVRALVQFHEDGYWINELMEVWGSEVFTMSFEKHHEITVIKEISNYFWDSEESGLPISLFGTTDKPDFTVLMEKPIGEDTD